MSADTIQIPPLWEVEWFNERVLKGELFIANHRDLEQLDELTNGGFRDNFLNLCVEFDDDLSSLAANMSILPPVRDKKQSEASLDKSVGLTFVGLSTPSTTVTVNAPMANLSAFAPKMMAFSDAQPAIMRSSQVALRASKVAPGGAPAQEGAPATENVPPSPPAAEKPVSPTDSTKAERASQSAMFASIVPQRVTDICAGAAVAALARGAIAVANGYADDHDTRTIALQAAKESFSGVVAGAELTAVITSSGFPEGVLIVLTLETGKALYYDVSKILKGEMGLRQFLQAMSLTRRDNILGMGAVAFVANKIGRTTPCISLALGGVALAKLIYRWVHEDITTRDLAIAIPQTVGSYAGGATGAVGGATFGLLFGGVGGAIAGSVLFGIFGALAGAFIGKPVGEFLADLFSLEDPIAAAYKVINATKHFTDGEIRRAYYARMREVHPDNYKDNKEHWTRVAQNVTGAKAVIDAHRRAVADRAAGREP